ncbi:NEDD8 activating enzyme [Dichomitus squalens]|uniref:NEDD8-activating enzyme E1 catalytic subunit n=1 Tax=Dichomitus squalens TaxID=114155 RepID=A0A4Q9QCT4_9APHY|nr:NEDD8 activating enzyme [Dichomitus squalens]
MAAAAVVNGTASSSEWEGRYYHVDQILDRSGPRTDPSFLAGDEVKEFLREKCKILVIGAGGLGCEILANLALSGFKDIHVIDMDTIDISNLNRQFLFRQKDVGKSKAIVAAEFIMNRVPGVKVTPYFGKIQDKDEDYYMQFNLIICGLDSVEARRWINATLVNMVDSDNPESLKPLIDGGTEGFKGQARVILPTVTSCYECSLDMLNKPTAFPICTIANTPRLPEHCIEWASVLEWPKVHGDKKLDTDNPEHISWLYQVAAARAKEFKIEGVTYSLTQGVVKNIIPAIASTNAIIAASCCNEAFKIATSSAAYLNNYFMLIGTDGVYSYTFEHEKRDDCPVCGGQSLAITVNKEWTVERLIDMLIERQDIQVKKPSLSTPGKQIYFQAPPQLELATRPNLEKKISDLVPDGGEITVTATTLPFNLSLRVKYT